jgi:hypothetical protein
VVKHNDVAVQGTLLGPVNRSKCIWHFLKVMHMRIHSRNFWYRRVGVNESSQEASQYLDYIH